MRKRCSRSSAPSATRLPDDKEWSHLANRLGLSPRETTVVRRILFDESDLVIAERLNISAHTVRTYIDRIFRGLGVGSRVQLVVLVMAMFAGLVCDRDRQLRAEADATRADS
jgi:DNA-binding CsgD family transcriptional regulator